MNAYTLLPGDYVAAAATTSTVTYAAKAAGTHRIHGIFWSLDADDATANILIQSGGVTVAKFYTPTKGPGFLPFNVSAAVGNAVTVALNSGAANGTMNVIHSEG